MNIAALLDAYQKSFISEVLFNEAMNKIDLALFAKGVTVELGADKNWAVMHTPSEMIFVWKWDRSDTHVNRVTGDVDSIAAVEKLHAHFLKGYCKRCEKWTTTMGVGEGLGRLFVHGDYDSIKAVQAIMLANEKLVRWKGEIDQRRTLAGLPFPSDYDDSPRAAVGSLIEHHVLYANKCYEGLTAAVEKTGYRVLEGAGSNFRIEPTVQLYSQEWWERSADGIVTYRRDANKDVPEWVVKSSAFRVLCEATKLPSQEERDSFGGLRALIADDSYADTFRSSRDYRAALLKAFEPPQAMRPSFGYSGVKWDSAEVQYWPDVTRVPTHNAKLTPTITHLLAALRNAIVDASPAKVD